MATIQKCIRLPEATVQEIELFASNAGRDFSSVARDLLVEAVKMKNCPGIIFADGPTGRRARVSGTGIDVWEIAAAFKGVGENYTELQKMLPHDAHLFDSGTRPVRRRSCGRSLRSRVFLTGWSGWCWRRRMARVLVTNWLPKIGALISQGHANLLILLVGTSGFEPPTPASRTLCSTRLSHVPTEFGYLRQSQTDVNS